MRDESNYFSDRPTIIETTPLSYRVQVNDVLNIQVQSTDPDVAGLFNLGGVNNDVRWADPGILFLTGYSVAIDGTIKLPIIGNINVVNKTIGEVQDLVQLEVDKFIIGATVNAKIVSFKVTVLGEVARPGMHYIFNGQATIFEALGMAGDITPIGRRDAVKLIRQNTASTTEVVLVDLTNPQLIVSPYYYVQPNDVLYAEPFKQNTDRTNIELLTIAGILFGFVSTTLLILNFVNTQ
ncbi:MAG TPA: polysaccharide biosynthesis/export family protein [Anaerolineaceae bacterium]|nr:polysaccharide biosynthesis/export family protein [Anaerolineaceae bacterium]